jgi:PTS system ascorbate-specific IIB component
MKILAVCGFGVGSSLILRMTITKCLKELGLEADVQNTDITDAKSYKADAIFTSPAFVGDLEHVVKTPLYAISKYSDKTEVTAQLKQLFKL